MRLRKKRDFIYKKYHFKGKLDKNFKFISELYIIFDKEFWGVPKFLCKKLSSENKIRTFSVILLVQNNFFAI